MAKKQFKAESKRLLDLMINSIYTHKEIFLREIISNASDAIDKLCYVALTDDKVGMNRSDFAITVSVDKENRTLTVSDNGIGMSREELENNLGVIASSGSYKFRQETEEKDKKDADIDIIGQFGVGFYSAFMVADSITVRTKKYGSEQAYEWQSSGADGYTITECDKEAVGTDVIMHINPTRTRRVQRVLGILPSARAREEVLRLHPLPHPHAAARAEGQRGQRPGEARVRDRRGDEDRQLHGAALAAQEE